MATLKKAPLKYLKVAKVGTLKYAPKSTLASVAKAALKRK